MNIFCKVLNDVLCLQKDGATIGYKQIKHIFPLLYGWHNVNQCNCIRSLKIATARTDIPECGRSFNPTKTNYSYWVELKCVINNVELK